MRNIFKELRQGIQAVKAARLKQNILDAADNVIQTVSERGFEVQGIEDSKLGLDLGEAFYDKQLADEMNAIAAILARSKEEGLQCEVVYQFAQEVKTKPITEACYHALAEWIK